MAVLWSEFLALWFDRTRRRALPLLLATLLLLIPSLPARSDCSCEMPSEGQQQIAHHHEGDGHDHEESEAHAHSVERKPGSVSSQNVGHARLVAWNQIGASRGGATCCSCPNAPLTTAVVAAPAPSNIHADNQTLVYARVSVLSAYSFDALTGLFGRAGPHIEGKPKHIFLASLAGRAPPV